MTRVNRRFRRHRRCLWLLLALGPGLGCPHQKQADPALLAEAPWAPPLLAGRVVDGRFVDERYGLSVPVPEGWAADPAAVSDTTRVMLIDPTGDVRLRVSVAPGAPGPEPRPDCDWAFQDAATYVFGVHHARLATCVPTDPDGPRVLRWYVGDAVPPIQLEAEVAPGALLEAEDTAASVLGGIRFSSAR